MKRYNAIPTDREIKSKSVPIVGILLAERSDHNVTYVIRTQDIDCTFVPIILTLGFIMRGHSSTFNTRYIGLADMPSYTVCCIIDADSFKKELEVTFEDE